MIHNQYATKPEELSFIPVSGCALRAQRTVSVYRRADNGYGVRNRMKRDWIWILVAFVMLAGAVLCMRGAMARPQVVLRYSMEEYDRMETEYREQLKDRLTDMGYYGAGVSVCDITDPDGNRDYRVEVHHARLTDASEESREALVEALKEVAFSDPGAEIRIRIQ